MLNTGNIDTTGANTGMTMTLSSIGSTNRTQGNPRGFVIPQGHFTGVQTGNLSLTSYGPYAFDVQYTNFSNEQGTFGKNMGNGNFTWSENEDTAMAIDRGSVKITEGPNQFGGTMQLLGSFFSNEGFYYKAHLSVAKYSWLFQYNGAGQVTCPLGGTEFGSGPCPGTTVTPNPIVTTMNGSEIDSRVYGFMFSWTTGTVSVTALHGPFPTVLARHGFDNRDARGAGEIQMVTPMLTRWVWTFGNYDTASIGHVKLDFAPEPQEWLMLAAGVSMLGLLYRSNRGSR
jgi:hypothetical protein